jgi:hypothetical protein
VKYSSLIGYLRLTCWKDPTSQFFQAERAHVPHYSTYRIQEAKEYADSIATGQKLSSYNKKEPPALCVGVASVERKGISYLKSTLGSLQHGLSAEERARLYFIVLLAHTNQTKHESYGQPWLASMADELPSYNDTAERLTIANAMEAKKEHGPKAKFDYSIVLEQCSKTGAPNILMLEDDVVLMDGWWPRVAEALDVARAKTWDLGRKDCKVIIALLTRSTQSRQARLGCSAANRKNSFIFTAFLLRRSSWLEFRVLAPLSSIFNCYYVRHFRPFTLNAAVLSQDAAMSHNLRTSPHDFLLYSFFYPPLLLRRG